MAGSLVKGGWQMNKNLEMIDIVSWVIGLMNFEQTEIKFYYNHQTGTFTKKFDMSVVFLSEKDVDQVLNQLDIEGLEKVKGTFKFPREDLMGILTETFIEFAK